MVETLEANMTVSTKVMNRMCDDCGLIAIAYWNTSGFCIRCRGRNFHKTEKGRVGKMAYYYRIRNMEGKRLTECGNEICETQKRQTSAHPCKIYIKYNKCVACNVLWSKDTMRCPHCNKPLKMKPKNKKHNSMYTNTVEKNYKRF